MTSVNNYLCLYLYPATMYMAIQQILQSGIICIRLSGKIYYPCIPNEKDRSAQCILDLCCQCTCTARETVRSVTTTSGRLQIRRVKLTRSGSVNMSMLQSRPCSRCQIAPGNSVIQANNAVHTYRLLHTLMVLSWENLSSILLE